MAADMTPFEQARAVAELLGMDFNAMIQDHFAPCHYVYSSPECFILAYDTYHEDGGLAVFVTLGCGSMEHFVSIDPRREERKWLGYVRKDGEEARWVPYSRLHMIDHI